MTLSRQHKSCTHRQCGDVSVSTGFTLVEMAVVLTIVGLLLGALLLPLSAQMQLRQLNETRQRLTQINDALIGFVLLNGRLPCPSFESNPFSANYGMEDCTNVADEGYLPWRMLGVPAIDAWGTIRSNAGDPWIGHWRYRVDENFFTVALFNANILNTGAPFMTDLRVWDGAGVLQHTLAEHPIAIIYSLGPDGRVNGRNDIPDIHYETGEPRANFDDVLIWIGRPQLVNRLAIAGRLP
jgi:prepilin-type N-terminal cleavage/methylation domain-containing protein